MSKPNSYTSGSIGGSTTARGDMKYKFLGFTQTKNSDNLITQVTYQGTKEKLQYERDRTNSPWAIGTWDTNYGRLQSVNIQPGNGPVFWNAVLNYNMPLTLGIADNQSQNNKPQEIHLDINMISLPIQKHVNYDYRWNHELIYTQRKVTSGQAIDPIGTQLSGITNYKTGNPLKWSDQWDAHIASDVIAYFTGGRGYGWLNVKWIRDENEIPPNAYLYYDTNEGPIVAFWKPYSYMRKPGVEFFDIPTYTITESGKYTKKSDCAWALKEGGLIAYPEHMGDFGIQMYYQPWLANYSASSKPYGYWRCEGGNIDYDGKYYNATCQYTWSPDPYGWDLQIYDFYNSWSYYLTKSKTNPSPLVTNSNTHTGFIIGPY